MGRNQRRWRNILLDLNFQLSFTTLLVGVAGVLMMLLGFWVKDVAHESTLVGLNRLEPMCEDLNPDTANLRAPAPRAAPAQVQPVPDEAAPATPAPKNDAKGDKRNGAEDPKRTRSKVVIENTSIKLEAPVAPVDVGPATAENYRRCLVKRGERIDRLWASYRLILIVLFGSSVLLILGLAVHGLRMTHKVAGPLFKVGLYLDKMRRGIYDQVWDLRKGDQLTEFYEHFRAAHGELVAMAAEDIAVLEEVLEAADTADDLSDEAKAAVEEVRELLDAKKKGLLVPDPAKEDKHG